MAGPLAMTTLTYETPRGPEISTALLRLARFILFMCLAKIAQDVIWPVNTWRLPPLAPRDPASAINWWSWIEPKIEFAARAALCIASGWFLLRPRRAWSFLACSAIALCIVAGGQQLLVYAASAAHHLGYLQELFSYHSAPMGLPGLLAGALTGLVLECGAMFVLLGLMRAAGGAGPASPWLTLNRVRWIACAALVPLCLWSFWFFLQFEWRIATLRRLGYLMSERWSIPMLGVIGDTLDLPISWLIDLAIALAAAVALATHFRLGRPLRVALWSWVAVILLCNALLALVVVSEYAGWCNSSRFRVRGDLLHTIQWISNFARKALSRPAYFIACLIVLNNAEPGRSE